MQRRIAQALWLAWAIVVWNVVFDHVIVVAGREYFAAAVIAARGPGPYARMDNWMRPAIARGLWIASTSSAAILVAGLVGIRQAVKRQRRIADSGRAAGWRRFLMLHSPKYCSGLR